MASIGFLGGLGQGLQGISQSLAQYLAMKQQDKDRALQQQHYGDEAQHYKDEAAYRQSHDEMEANRYAEQLKRQKLQDDRGLVEKVLGNITGNTRVTPEFAQQAKDTGLDTFVSDAPPTMMLNPITHTPMAGGAQVPGGIMARPMISPAVQAQIDSLNDKSGEAETRLRQGQQHLDDTARYNMGMLDAKGSALGLQEQALLLRQQLAEQQNDLRAANERQRAYVRIASDVQREAVQHFPLAGVDPQEGAKMEAWAANELQTRLAGSIADRDTNAAQLKATTPIVPTTGGRGGRPKMPKP